MFFPKARDLKNFPKSGYAMESRKSISQVLWKRRLILFCGGEQLFMISPEKNESSQRADSQAHPSFLATRRYKMEMQISF